MTKRLSLSVLPSAKIAGEIAEHPRRMSELMRLLENREIAVRGRAAAALALLSDIHPERLARLVDRLRAALGDEAAYVRWNLVYALGRVGSRFPGRASIFLPDLSERLDDENRIVRFVACRALARLAARKPQDVEKLFASSKREIPGSVARILRKRSGVR